MKKLTLLFLPLINIAQSVPNYWQQEVAYVMHIDFDVEKHQFEGKQELTYTNNSPDTLRQVFYHLYFNAFQPGSMMDERANHIPDPDKRIGRRIEKLKPDEIGYHKIKSLTQDGKPLFYEVTETILQAQLSKPLPPGESTVLEMNFKAQVPLQIRRSGRNNAEGIDYTMTQWYPKLAEYDENGWHPNPYVSREFYAPYGSFDITIKIDSEYKLGGTGELQNFDAYWKVEKEEGGLQIMHYLQNKKKKREWQFKAVNVHDFAWAADPLYNHTMTKGPQNLKLHFFYLDSVADTWEKLPAYTTTFFELMSRYFGKYDYSQFSVVQGGDGGMEYPMCTMLKGTGKLEGLVGVMVHEAAHSWFHGMLGSNEFQYPWMDEGFTSFAEEKVLNEMKEEPSANPHVNAYFSHIYMVRELELEPLATPADYFSTNKNYGISAYRRGEVFVAQLQYILGAENFSKGMLEYYRRWKFKHPDPWDFIKVMEDVSGIQLDWYLNFWLNTNKLIDYAVEEVSSTGKNPTLVRLKRIGEMPMPLDITITTKRGDSYRYHIPLVSMFGAKKEEDVAVLKPWAWTSAEYQWRLDLDIEEINSIRIDPLLLMADINPLNNVWPPEEKKGD